MSWLTDLLFGESIASAALILALVAASGLAIGSIRIYSIRLGIAGVLFSGLIFGHFQIGLEHHIMEFAREFGLILFVYSIGLQVGPGFLNSLRREGLSLNVMAASIVLLGVAVTVGVALLGGVEIPVAVGLFSGATTNTPSLAAAQAALEDAAGYSEAVAKMPGLGYAVAYPFGIIGIILTMLGIRALFRVDSKAEEADLRRTQCMVAKPIERVNLQVENPNLDGMTLCDIPLLTQSGVVFSRIMHGDEVSVITADTVLHLGDVVLAVGHKDKLHALELLFGRESAIDLHKTPSAIATRRLIVTQRKVLGKTVEALGFDIKYAVRITRVIRMGVELPPGPDVRLQFGDTLVAVGEPPNLDEAARRLGNSTAALNHPQVVPIFVGIALGVVLGSWPIAVPGLPAPVRLGLAGGPLVVAIALSRIGRIGGLIWYLPTSANFMLRELGIILFLACVGLKSGDQFIATLTQGDGLKWMALASLITLIPLVTVALIGRIFLKVNYLRLCGLLAGSMTDPPALAFAGTVTQSDAPTVAYATVYPLTMILRILCAQAMVLLLM